MYASDVLGIVYSNVYDESPVRLIEPLMNNLFSYLTSSRQGFILKIAITMFYVNYIKPFEAYNELISTLLSTLFLLLFLNIASSLPIICSLLNGLAT